MFILWLQYADNSVAFEKFSSVEEAEQALKNEKFLIAHLGGEQIINAEINEGLGSCLTT